MFPHKPAQLGASAVRWLLAVVAGLFAVGLIIFVLGSEQSSEPVSTGPTESTPAPIQAPSSTPSEAPAAVDLQGDSARAQALTEAELDRAADPLEFEIVGRVLGSDGKPCAGAFARLYASNIPMPGFSVVGAFRDNGYILGEVQKKTGSDGRFKLRQPFRDGADCLLVITHADAAPLSKPHVWAEAGQRVDVGDLTLGLGGEITGQILDASGSPVPSARVGVIETPTLAAADSILERTDLEESFAADGEGNFKIPHLTDGRYTVIAWAPGSARGASPPVVVAHDKPQSPLSLRLMPGDSITGMVVDVEGKPIADAKVKVRLQKPEQAQQAAVEVNENADPMLYDLPFVAVTDGAGQFEAQGLLMGLSYNLTAKALGYRDQGASAKAGTTGQRIVMRPDLRVAGVVVDEATGQPVSGLRVATYRGKPEDLRPRDLERAERAATSDSQGRFLATDHERPGVVRVVAWGKTYAPSFSEPVQLVEKGEIPQTTIKATAGGVLAGRIENGDRTPTAEASVYLYYRDPRIANAQFRSGTLVTRRTADAAGAFRFEGLMPGTYQVEARATSRGTARAENVTVGPGETREGVLLTMPAPAVIRGTVQASGSLVPIRVVATRVDGTQSGVFCDLENRFELKNLSAGTYQVRAEQMNSIEELLAGGRGRAGMTSAMQQVELREGQAAEVVLQLPESYLGKIVGTVTDENGPGAGYSIVLIREAAVGGGRSLQQSGNGPPQFNSHKRATADLQGNFELVGIAEGNYRIYAVPLGKAIGPKNAVASETVQAMANGAVRRDLYGRSGKLHGLVRRADGGPVNGGQAVARVNGTRGGSNVLPPGATFRTSVRKGGAFNFGVMPGGSYDVTIEAGGLPPKAVPYDVYGGYGSPLEITLEAAAPKPKPGPQKTKK
ncbi:MAG: carboxypeptidase regulatory-like domain-containing protein [Planctomycetes bacterium]|nr:carboxypeptidase regulatory-like domain-containing protein [Planctomycetota bacterium]